MYILSNWIIIQRTKPDGEVVVRLRGKVFGHPRFGAGGVVTVAALQSCRQEGDTIAVITRTGSEYVLGKPHRREPMAKVRLLRHLRKTPAPTAKQGSMPVGRVAAG